ncbi:MAG: helix-turn-helix domain-containing protein [Deltaproteobacteria bacterium]|nr:helix-turn-helix domain-containing protein [Deltaproteobacteria bacterium]MBI3390293.1 helix-turn-helix domain-containing protein [Deltaproteobacteria bacterium]
MEVAVAIEGETLLTVADVAKRLGIVPATVRHIATQGKLPSLRTLSGVRIFLLRDVEQLEIQRAAERRKPD